jgi:glycosyltransferase involved in cell wall biosynthesis
MKSAQSICVIASGHITTCPRMMKAAEAFHEAGYLVRVISSSHARWLAKADANFLSSRGWQHNVAYFDRETHAPTYYWTGLRYRLSRGIVKLAGAKSVSLGQLGVAFTRPFSELLQMAASVPSDLYYAGTSGGVAVAAELARRTGRPYALDLEDFHSAEQDASSAAELSHQIVAEIEGRVLAGAKFVTCGSEAMAEAYAEKYGVRPIPINNVFSLPAAAPDFKVTPGRLRVVWLGQTVGPGRGIEDAIAALGIAERPCELLLRGRVAPGYLDHLKGLARAQSPNLELRHAEPDMSRSVVDLCRGSDVGLALEQAHILNRAVCLCNKPFTYMLAGLAIAFTDTPGQRALAQDLGRGAVLFKVGDVAKLAERLRWWADDVGELVAARRAAWHAAVRRWNWDHPLEKERLLTLARSVLQHPR